MTVCVFITSQQMRELAGAVVGPVTALKTVRETETHKHEDVHNRYSGFLLVHYLRNK